MESSWADGARASNNYSARNWTQLHAVHEDEEPKLVQSQLEDCNLFKDREDLKSCEGARVNRN